MVILQHEVSSSKYIEVNFSEGQDAEETESISLFEEDAIKQEYIRSAEKYHIDSPYLKQQINASEVADKFLPKQIDLDKIVILIERKV